MATRGAQNGLLTALAEFEKCLGTPVISGELPSWMQAARQACEKVGAQLQGAAARTHEKLLSEMALEDPDLLPRIDELRATEVELTARQSDLQRHFDQLRDRAEAVEPHEQKLDDQIEQLIEQGLRLVIDVRRHETALTTWYLEAFDRDRGMAD